MLDPAIPPSTKVRAADSIWGHTVKAIELEDIEGRLAALEQDASKLVPHTRKWLLYWTEQIGKYMTGELNRQTLPWSASSLKPILPNALTSLADRNGQAGVL